MQAGIAFHWVFFCLSPPRTCTSVQVSNSWKTPWKLPQCHCQAPETTQIHLLQGNISVFLEIITTSPGISLEPWGYLMFKLETPSRKGKVVTTWISWQTLQGHRVASLLGVPSVTCLDTCSGTCPLTWKWWATNCPISLSEHLTSQAALTMIFTENKIWGLHGLDSHFLLDV